MLKIGDFSSITNTPIKTIRYYEEIGLLFPTEVDVYTGYRHYSEENIYRLMQIKYLKNLGFSLKEIKNLSENIVKEKAKALEKQIYNVRKNLFTILL